MSTHSTGAWSTTNGHGCWGRNAPAPESSLENSAATSEVAARTPLEQLAHRYLAAQLRGDRREALRILVQEGVNSGHSPGDLRTQVIRWAQRQIGILWESNKVTIAQEHIASAISQFALSHLYQHENAQPPLGVKVVVACVQGELHELAARIVADQLEVAGFDVRFVGADTPIESLVSLLERERPEVLALSVSMSFNVGALRETVLRVRERYPALKIVAGGRALSWAPGITRELQLNNASEDMDVVGAVRRLVRGEE